jgi:hypothetical protein
VTWPNLRKELRWELFEGLERFLPRECIVSINIHVDDLASRFHDVTGWAVVLEERVFNILSIHQVRDFAISEVTFLLIEHILKEGIRLKKAFVITESLPDFVCFADVDYLQLLVYGSRNAVNTRILGAVK